MTFKCMASLIYYQLYFGSSFARILLFPVLLLLLLLLLSNFEHCKHIVQLPKCIIKFIPNATKWEVEKRIGEREESWREWGRLCVLSLFLTRIKSHFVLFLRSAAECAIQMPCQMLVMPKNLCTTSRAHTTAQHAVRTTPMFFLSLSFAHSLSLSLIRSPISLHLHARSFTTFFGWKCVECCGAAESKQDEAADRPNFPFLPYIRYVRP